MGGRLAVERRPGAVPGCRAAQPRELLDGGRVGRDKEVVDLRGAKVAAQRGLVAGDRPRVALVRRAGASGGGSIQSAARGEENDPVSPRRRGGVLFADHQSGS